MLATDDPHVVQALQFVGQVYGTLLQFSDDIKDANTQPPGGATLIMAYHAARADQHAPLPQELTHYWYFLHRQYTQQVQFHVIELPVAVQHAVKHVFTTLRDVPRAHEVEP